MLRRGQWRSPSFLGGDVRILLLLSAFAALVRAFDYLTGSESGSSSLSSVERALPLWGWAAALIFGVLALLVGMTGRWTPVVITGHLTLAAIYVGLAVGYNAMALQNPWADGIRNGAQLMGPAVLHLLCASRATWMGRRRAGEPVVAD